MSCRNYELRGQKARYFTGPISDITNNFRTIPNLLRSVADWMDENNIQDPESEALTLKAVLGDGEDEPFYEAITLYYIDNPQR